MSGKLTKAQRDLLEDCHRDERGMVGVVANFASARILVSRGLAVWRDGDPHSERLTITDAGRQALQEQDK